MSDQRTDFEQPLSALGQILEERGERFELLAIGGGALQLLGLITRPTRDVDVVAFVDDQQLAPLDRLPDALERAVRDVATVLGMPATWFNAGPRSLVEFGLPSGAVARAHLRRWGGLTLHLADRLDQICFKLYAAVDQGPQSKHMQDLRLLAPTPAELRVAAEWTRRHDPSEAFNDELRAALRDLEVADADR